jgi:hypothetical protein
LLWPLLHGESGGSGSCGRVLVLEVEGGKEVGDDKRGPLSERGREGLRLAPWCNIPSF